MDDVTEEVSLGCAQVRFGSKGTEDIPGRRSSLDKDIDKRAWGEGAGKTGLRRSAGAR